MHRNDWVAIVGLGVIALITVLFFEILNGCTPVEAQHREDEGKQAGALTLCITTAKAMDASHDERYAAYTKCADDVDRDAGRIP